MVTVANWSWVKVVGSMLVRLVCTLVTVAVVRVVRVAVVEVRAVEVTVVVWAGTKSVDSETEVMTDETATVV